MNNCGKVFHLEVASRDFETELRRLLTKSQPKVAEKLRQSLKKWAEGEFKSDSQLGLIPSLYSKLKQEGHDFSSSDPTTKVCYRHSCFLIISSLIYHVSKHNVHNIFLYIY